MLSEDAIENLVQPIVERQQAINEYVIKIICRRVKEIGHLLPSDLHRLERILQMGGDVKKINEEIARQTGLQVKEIKKLIKEVAIDGYVDAKPYYDYHRSLLMRNDRRAFSASDRIIYSEGVTVFRVDTRQGQAYTEDWYQIDVITCAAPWFKSKDDLPLDEQLYHIFDSRIRNILESAIEYEAEALVLGAFGCGPFHNPPEIVSKAFRNILLEDRYRHAFDHVVFAVKRTGSFCENIECFEIEFSRFPERAEFSSERNKRRFFE